MQPFIRRHQQQRSSNKKGHSHNYTKIYCGSTHHKLYTRKFGPLRPEKSSVRVKYSCKRFVVKYSLECVALTGTSANVSSHSMLASSCSSCCCFTTIDMRESTATK